VNEASRINLTWLVRLRWGAFVGQGLLVLAVDGSMGIALPTLPLLVIIGVGLATNGGLTLWQRGATQVGDAVLSGVMLLDALLLTALLYLSGGPFNPFSTLYLVNVALAAVLLPARWAWGLLMASLLAFGSLFLLYRLPAPGGLPLPSHAELMRLHIEGMWVAFALAAGFIVYFVQRVRRALAAREAELARARDLASRREKVTALATLAAGAAHELATPLSTIAVVAKEVEEALAMGPQEVRADLQLVRAQVERCRLILQRMAAGAGEAPGEALVRVPVVDCVKAALEQVESAERVVVEVARDAEGCAVSAPRRALAGALAGLVRNALQASQAPMSVRIYVVRDDERCWVEVRDHGRGMTQEELHHAGEPFFTTKPPGAGMGLGLFLTRTLVEHLGGQLTLESASGAGTTARLELPLVELPGTEVTHGP
jgi:two-component system, sensor histidine kinase RegB